MSNQLTIAEEATQHLSLLADARTQLSRATSLAELTTSAKEAPIAPIYLRCLPIVRVADLKFRGYIESLSKPLIAEQVSKINLQICHRDIDKAGELADQLSQSLNNLESLVPHLVFHARDVLAPVLARIADLRNLYHPRPGVPA